MLTLTFISKHWFSIISFILEERKNKTYKKQTEYTYTYLLHIVYIVLYVLVQEDKIMENHFNKRVGVTPSEADAVSGTLLFISAGSISEESSSWLLRLIFVYLCRNKNTNPIQISVEDFRDPRYTVVNI